MTLISYDISNDKLRTKFSKYIRKYGPRIQYSVYEIDNTPRILDTLYRRSIIDLCLYLKKLINSYPL